MAKLNSGTRIYGNTAIDTFLTVSGGIASNSNTTGTLIVTGGVGITGNIYSGNVYITGTSNGITFADGTRQTTAGSGSGSSNWAVKTTTYTAVNGDKLLANTAGGAFTITLPASPSVGHNVEIADDYDWSVTNLTVARNGSTIGGLAEDVTMNVKGAVVIFAYDGTTWRVYASFVPVISSGVTITDDTASSNTNYLTMSIANTGTFSNAYVSSSKLYFTPSTGTLNSTDYNSLSDRNLKENIINIVDGLSIISKINPVEFTWKENNRKSFGVIAQEIEEILPDLVQMNDEGIKSVSYIQIIPILIQAIKELKEKIEILKGK